MPQNFYQILGIPTTASAKTIQKAFHKLAKTYHPDRNPQNNLALEQFKLISEAYKTLSNPSAKSKYDFKIRYGIPTTKGTYRQPPQAPKMARAAKRKFTRRAQILGGVSVILILAVVIISSFILLRYNARYNFQRGLSNYENKRYSASYFNLKQSLGLFNPYQATTHFLMADICFSQHAENQLTVNHINLALQANPSDSLRARLYFLQGKLSYQQNLYEKAYTSFEEATLLLPNLDSAYYQMGEMDTFVFNRYDRAIGHYELILNSKPNFYDAYLGMAYCFHKLRLFDSAITAVDRCLDIRNDVGMAYYIKGLSAQSLNQKVLACDSFQAAGNLGLTVAVDSLSSYCQNYPPTTSN